MADLTTPTTKIEAVNLVLKNCGYTETSTLEGAIGRDASSALKSIENETRSLCRRGMWFSRRDILLTPDEDTSFLVLPATTLTIRPPSNQCTYLFSKQDWIDLKPVMRSGKVYSVINQSFEFTNPLALMIYEALPFDDLPDEARTYAWVYSALELNRSGLRSDSVEKDLKELLAPAWDALVQAELDNSNHRFI